MSDKSFNEALYEDRIHFMECSVCGEFIDMRDIDEVFQHEGEHKPRPDTIYSGSKRIN